MQAVLLVIHLIVAVAIIVTILIQPSEAGGFMGSGGSMANMMAPRRRGDVLTRTTTILAGLFFATSLLLAISANNQPVRKSILDLDTGDKPAAASTVPAQKDATPKAPITDDGTTPADKVATEKTDAGKTDADKAATAEDDKAGDKAANDDKPLIKPAAKKKTPKAPVTK